MDLTQIAIQAILIALCLALAMFAIYFGSKIQMKAWLKELDHFLGEKLVDYINNNVKRKEDGKEEKK